MSKLIPEGLPKGKELLEEGKKIGNAIEVGKSLFELERNCSFWEWRLSETRKGNIHLIPQMGLSTVDEHVEAIKELYKECKRRGVDISAMLVTSNMLNGLPPELRDRAPRGTSFILESLEDFVRIVQAAPIMQAFADNMFGTPNSVSNVTNAFRAGSTLVGTMSQFTWDYPYWDNDVGQLVETIKAAGIIASKRELGASLGSYVGDGISASFLDHATEVGYCLLEQYVAEKLCGCRYGVSLGGLMSHIPSKMATWLAINDVARLDVPVIGHIEGNTLEVTEDTESNYGLVVADFIPYAILEHKYNTGACYIPKPITEAIKVPTLNEIVNVASVCVAALKKIPDYIEAKMFDETKINELRRVLATNGLKFFQNTLKGLSEMGIDINDPLQLLLAVRRLGGARLEEMFHPGERDSSKYKGIVPFASTDLIKTCVPIVDYMIETIRSEGLGDIVKDKRIVAGSTDTHEFGLYVVDSVLRAFGARVTNAGVDLDAEEILDLASKKDTPYIVISTHNGQCLDWGKRLTEVAQQRQQPVKVFMGGALNAILKGATEPVDVSDRLSELGIKPCQEAADIFRKMVRA